MATRLESRRSADMLSSWVKHERGKKWRVRDRETEREITHHVACMEASDGGAGHHLAVEE